MCAQQAATSNDARAEPPTWPAISWMHTEVQAYDPIVSLKSVQHIWLQGSQWQQVTWDLLQFL